MAASSERTARKVPPFYFSVSTKSLCQIPRNLIERNGATLPSVCDTTMDTRALSRSVPKKEVSNPSEHTKKRVRDLMSHVSFRVGSTVHNPYHPLNLENLTRCPGLGMAASSERTARKVPPFYFTVPTKSLCLIPRNLIERNGATLQSVCDTTMDTRALSRSVPKKEVGNPSEHTKKKFRDL